MVLKSGIRARQPPASHLRQDFTMWGKKSERGAFATGAWG